MDFPASIDTAAYETVAPTTQASSQCSLVNAVNQTSYLGNLLFFLMLGCLCFRWWHRKQSKQQVSDDHRQQIERLERIWKMRSHQEP
jgi:uncharacterized membrane protein